MSYALFISLLVVVWFAFEIYLLWLNYKGRFEYKLKEMYSIQRWLQERIGVMTLPVTLLSGGTVIWLAPYVIALIFDIPYTVALPSVVSGILGLRVLNVISDRWTLKNFEKYCLQCENKEECNKFLNEKCGKEYLKHSVRMAVECDKKREEKR